MRCKIAKEVPSLMHLMPATCCLCIATFADPPGTQTMTFVWKLSLALVAKDPDAHHTFSIIHIPLFVVRASSGRLVT